MCTVSIIPSPLHDASRSRSIGFRLVCNRDERWERADASVPRWREIEGEAGRAIWPADGEAGGTWVAADQNGLTLCLLNRNTIPPTQLPTAGLQSRGRIIPMLLPEGTGDAVSRAAGDLDLEAFAPFRLIAVDPHAPRDRFIHEIVWDRKAFTARAHPIAPICFASSGLGDDRVLVRLDLFESMVVGSGATPEAQDLFHGHSWADRPEISVLMTRSEARTVSMTHVEVAEQTSSKGAALGAASGMAVRMRYRPVLAEAGRTAGLASDLVAVRSLARGGPVG